MAVNPITPGRMFIGHKGSIVNISLSFDKGSFKIILSIFFANQNYLNVFLFTINLPLQKGIPTV